MKKNNNLSPAMEQYKKVKDKYKDCILFYRLGDFYEMFYEDAEIASRELGLTLTGKNCGLTERAPMCGVPFHAYEQYAAKLIDKGYKVAICEQLAEPIRGTIVPRDVIRIITPGTVIESSMLDEKLNSYIMCVYKYKDTISYAYADISTGEFCVGRCSGDKIINYLNDQIMRVEPAEIICNEEMLNCSNTLPVVKSKSCKSFNQYYEWCFNYNSCEKAIKDCYDIISLKGYDFYNNECVIAIGALLQYVVETQKRELKHLNMPKFIYDNQYMYIDTNTRRNLEIESTMREGQKYGSLLWVLDRTQTGSGARMIRRYVGQPLQNIDEINERLNIVEALKNSPIIRSSLIANFKGIRDIERIVGKLSYGTITPKECISILETLEQAPKIKNTLINSNNISLKQLGEKIIDLEDLKIKISKTIKREPPAIFKDGDFINDGFSSELDRLRGLSCNAHEYLNKLQEKEREETGIKNLKIGYNKVFGYFIEVNKQYADIVPFRYIRKQTISNNERYITEELKQFENEVLSSQENSLKLEMQLYEKFKAEIFCYHFDLQNLANVLSIVDAMLSFAIVADENNYVKPQMTNNNIINIKNGRHPVIERLQKSETFIANDATLDTSENKTMILTGPNMAGKSTYMRQIALITLMAHIGCFVPADYAEICIVDRIFTRIGASDDLAVGQSTFMVEMVEVSNILRFATDKSVVILDEVGRGTSTHDGLSIAWAVVEYVSKNLNCKTLFATHYHELMQLEGQLEGVKNYCISIKEIAGELVFLRKIMRGSATRSYGIEVASLAGLPNEIINRAKEILIQLQGTNCKNAPVIQAKTQTVQKYSEVIDIIKSCDINNMSPMIAFDTLARLCDLCKED